MACLLGIDNGLTVTKAVVFDESGRPLSVARRRINQIIDRPRHVERSMVELWSETAAAIREAIETSGRAASDIAAISATAHGDGVYLLDASAQPLGNGILSLDSRSGGIVEEWERDGVSDKVLQLSGQVPHASAPSAILAWIRRHEPERFERIGHVIACKDWLRTCLTGTIGTDLTEASTSFSNVSTQTYDIRILEVLGLEGLMSALAPVSDPDEIVGFVTPLAAAATGLVAGTPVVAGIHDVTASALGVGGLSPGCVAIVAGTYSINETLTLEPRIRHQWFCRNGLRRGDFAGVGHQLRLVPRPAVHRHERACRTNWAIDPCHAGARHRGGVFTPLDAALPSLSFRIAPWFAGKCKLHRLARVARSQ